MWERVRIRGSGLGKMVSVGGMCVWRRAVTYGGVCPWEGAGVLKALYGRDGGPEVLGGLRVCVGGGLEVLGRLRVEGGVVLSSSGGLCGCDGPKILGAEGLCVWGGVLISIQEFCAYGNEVVSIGEVVCEGEWWSEDYMVVDPQQVWGAVWMRMSVYLGGVCEEGFL